MSSKRPKGRYVAVAAHDGQAWRLFTGGDVSERIAPILSPANRLPQTLVEQAAEAKSRSVLFLISGDVHRMDGAIPAGMSLDKANEVIRASVAEATGVETDGLIVAGLSMTWGGVRKPFTLAGRFDGDMVEDFHAALAEAGILCAGFASLEQTLLAVWKPSRDASLLVIGHGHAFLAPAQRGANPGPQTVPCGIRHFAMDAANWLSRFQRAAPTVAKDAPLHVLALSEHSSGIKSAALLDVLREAGYANVIEEAAADWLRKAARTALLAKPNRTHGVSVPVANPYEPRKKFSHAWLAAVALAILALPAAFRWACEWNAEKECRRLAAEAAPFRPLEQKIKKAKSDLAAAEAGLAGEQATQRARIAARRPLMAFMDVAFYFCRHSGASLTLDAIEQSGDTIKVNGTFTDPEDGVRLNKGILEYALQKNIEVTKNESVNVASGDAAFINRFSIALDCSKVGEEAAK